MTETVNLQYFKLHVLTYILHAKIDVLCCKASLRTITKTCLYSFGPFKPLFHIVKLGFTWAYIICLIFAQNIDCVLVRIVSQRRF